MAEIKIPLEIKEKLKEFSNLIDEYHKFWTTMITYEDAVKSNELSRQIGECLKELSELQKKYYSKRQP